MADSIDLRFAATSRSNTIRKIDCGTTTPRMSGTVDVSCYKNLEELFCPQNDITTVILVSSLEVLKARDNRLGAKLSDRPQGGAFPLISACELLQYCDVGQNVLSANIPELSANVELTTFKCDNNQILAWNGSIDSISPNLGRFEAQHNLLVEPTVDGILKSFDKAERDASGNKECVLYLHEPGNSPPSFTGGILITADGTAFKQEGTTVTCTLVSDNPVYNEKCHGLENGWLVSFFTDTPTMTGTAVVNVLTLSSFSYQVIHSVVNPVIGSGVVTMRTTTNATDGYRFYQKLDLPLNQTYQGVQGKGWDVRINQPTADIQECYVDYFDDGHFEPVLSYHTS